MFSFSRENSSFNRTQPRARTIAVTFPRPEIVRIDCDLHPWMRAWVVVAEHPFYAVTNERGEFVLENLPPGRYTLHVWQETLGRKREEILVSDPRTSITIEMGRR